MPEASFSSLPSPKNGGALLLGEPPPPRPPDLRQQLGCHRAWFLGTLTRAESDPVFSSHLPGQHGGSGLMAASAKLTSESPAPGTVPGTRPALSVCLLND